jgi:hypothetical protein
MRTHFLHRSFLLAFPFAILSVPGFSQAPSGPGSTRPAPADATEAARVQAFLDARYKASDVRYSFHTRAAQDIDCVDFFAEPGVKALAARGQALTIPKPPPLPEELKKRAPAAGPRPEDDFAFRGQPDLYGNPEKCPEGSVPEVRITAEEIARAGGLDEYIRRLGHKVPPPRVIRREGNRSVCQDYPNYAHITGTLFSGQPGIQFGSTTMSIYGPNLGTVGSHSLSQVWLFSGVNTSVGGGPTCTSDCVQSVEFGWTVDNSLNTDTNTPHLFSFSTNNGYGNGCYNNVPNLPGACVPWVPLPGASFALNQALGYAPPNGGQPVELQATVILVGEGYWITLDIGSTSSYIGYYPNSDFTTSMDTFQVGGEVSSKTGAFGFLTGLDMGSGLAARFGYGRAAYHRDFSAMWFDGTKHWSTGANVCATRPADYDYSTTAPAGLSTWDGYFYYGTECAPPICR